jgi:erythronate-4-phosphate dehydrogenase
VDEFFSAIGTVTRFDGRNLAPEALENVDVLLIRSITKVNEALLSSANKLKFVGTATIGMDHVDQELLKQRGIFFTNAPGCNALAVAEYVISAILAHAQQTGMRIAGKTLGIVGYGNIGTRLAKKAKALGLNILLCDGPKHQAGELAEHVDLQQVLSQSDFVSLHVPLVKSGEHQTVHLIGQEQLALLKPNALLINSCRGDVIDNQALLSHMQTNPALTLVLDVWENEPNIEQALIPYLMAGSVHIAGHTLEGKARGTEMLYAALCNELNKSSPLTISDFLPRPAIEKITLSENTNDDTITQLVHGVYDVRRDFGLLKSGIITPGFDYLRKNYPIRREFNSLTVSVKCKQLANTLSQLGFDVTEDN